MARPRRCPVCRKRVGPRPANRSWPFCSDRCRLMDLGRWLGEEYRIPGQRPGDAARRPGGTGEDGEES